jgi:prepilin-type N-terminal cleavage/methylation domain-containing protein
MTSRSAFSLLEMLCAILVLGIGLVGLVQGITTALASNTEAERHTIAALLAEGRMEMLRAEGYFERRSEEGDFGESFPAYLWRETLEETQTEGLFDVRIAILHADSGRMLYQLETRLFEIPGLAEDEWNATRDRGTGGLR